MKILVTGASGFIGSNLVDHLLHLGHTVTGVDNFSTGQKKFLNQALSNEKFTLKELDLYDPTALHSVLTKDFEWVFHLSANADIKDGLAQPRKDLEQNTIVTWNVLEAMRRVGVKNIGFSSTGSVYGEAKVIPTPEDAPFPIQTSLYGASKAACEGLLSSYVEGYQFRAVIYRFVSILGERYTHGHVFDFIKQLLKNPNELKILGDGTQRKSYLYVGDCVRAITKTSLDRAAQKSKTEIFNLGWDGYVTVNQSIEAICAEMGVNPKKIYSGGDRGWVGDNPFIYLDTKKLVSTGWKPELNILDGVRRTVKYLIENQWVFENRN